MTEEEYIELEDGVEFYLKDTRGNYYVIDEEDGIRKQVDVPEFAWKICKTCGISSSLEMGNIVCAIHPKFYVGANQQLCTKLRHQYDEICYGFARCGKYQFVFDSFDWKKRSHEPVFVKFLASYVLK